jgi:hypothetical protein
VIKTNQLRSQRSNLVVPGEKMEILEEMLVYREITQQNQHRLIQLMITGMIWTSTNHRIQQILFQSVRESRPSQANLKIAQKATDQGDSWDLCFV